MGKYLIKKIFFLLLVLAGAATCSFLLLRMLPGDPAQAMAGPQATASDVENVRQAFGLDKSLPEQYITYMGKLAKGDFGMSYRSRRPVLDEIITRWPATMKLSLSSMLVAVVVGVPLGIFAARRRGKPADTISMAISFLGVSMPSFWLGMVLIVIFSVHLKWFPFYGMDSWKNYVLPSLTLGLGVAASIARLTRVSMLDVLDQDYIRTARGKGVRESLVVYVHGLRNAAVSIITIIGLQLGALLGGQVVTETLFSWPGIGRMIVDGLNTRDYMVVQGGIIVLAFTFAVINLIVDILYAVIDPRIRL